MPQTPEALPWWKRDNWTNITEEGGPEEGTKHTENAYKGYGDCFTFSQLPLQQSRVLPLRLDGQAQRETPNHSIFRPNVNSFKIDRRNDLRMGYSGTMRGAQTLVDSWKNRKAKGVCSYTIHPRSCADQCQRLILMNPLKTEWLG
jgi:hypothetical protein